MLPGKLGRPRVVRLLTQLVQKMSPEALDLIRRKTLRTDTTQQYKQESLLKQKYALKM